MRLWCVCDRGTRQRGGGGGGGGGGEGRTVPIFLLDELPRALGAPAAAQRISFFISRNSLVLSRVSGCARLRGSLRPRRANSSHR